MNQDCGTLHDEILRVYPEARLELLSEGDLAALRAAYPGLPEHYLAFLRDIGWGAIGSKMFYSGPVPPEDVCDEETPQELDGILFFADNRSEEMWGFDTRHGWRIVLVSCEGWWVEPEPAGTVQEFLREWLRDQ